MKISKIIFLGVLALTSGQDPADPDTTQPAEPTEEGIKITVVPVIHSPPLRFLIVNCPNLLTSHLEISTSRYGFNALKKALNLNIKR